MTIHRVSLSVVRSCIRPGAGVAPLHRFQLRQQSTVSSDGDIGGLGGQQIPPPGRGGRDFMKQNWVRLGGAALLIAVGVSYVSSPPKKRESLRDLKAASSTEIGMEPPVK
ncbi:hypothetical protein B0J13DRAFT_197872 [Dactylonectria estremocensis]|uniref:Uncharacterized protein n=1 Tax=Dactylonectria estremocensis TaxID=1079267 RepID=A0A9P9IFV7_9HYPO|nr:hypothetical protein B0J13DRAFT_197872 [Dactylonectria estremocensis]